MAEIDVSGTLSGAGDISGAASYLFTFGGTLAGAGDVSSTPVRVLYVSGAFSGSDGIVGSLSRSLIVGGQTYGAGTLYDQFNRPVSGTFVGSGTLVGTLFRYHVLTALPMVGSGTLGDNIPEPMVGIGTLSGYLDSVHIPCPCPPVLSAFRWRQQLQRGDLELHTCDATGLPYSPIVVVYSLYYVLPGGVPVLAGPPNRRPAQAGMGKYYATGDVGNCGQPGEWIIQWRWQRFWYEAPQVYEQHFLVQDSIMAGLFDPSTQSCKKGWL